MQRPAKEANHLRTHSSRFLGDFAHGTFRRTFARLHMSFGQIPAPVAVNHQIFAAIVHYHAARSLDSSEFLPEEGKRLLGIGRTNRNLIVSFQKIKYLRPGNTPALRKIDGKKTCRRRFIGKIRVLSAKYR